MATGPGFVPPFQPPLGGQFLGQPADGVLLGTDRAEIDDGGFGLGVDAAAVMVSLCTSKPT